VRIGIVAGEVSGDQLGADLIRALRKKWPQAQFEGIAGPAMQAEGCVSLYAMERLSVIGFELLEKLPGLLRMRRALAAHFTANPPDVFIGIDAPDFNIGLEKMLHDAGIHNVHYVSPTVWAWRRWRTRKIARAVDLMLTLFPFEASYFEEHRVPVVFVGHPLADVIPERYDAHAARARLGLPPRGAVVALLPGSRVSELQRHAELFVRTAMWLARRQPQVHFVVPFVNERTRSLFDAALDRVGAAGLALTRVSGRSREVMGAADVVLLASGTATLEAALLRKPMVVTYRLSWFSYFLVRLLVRVRRYALPNLLAGTPLVPELMQQDAVPEKLGAAVERFLVDPSETRRIKGALARIHRALRRNASERAAEAVVRLVETRASLRGKPA
jgi:lipid-A-disaccharide synthase